MKICSQLLLIAVMVFLLTGCTQKGPGAGIRRASYPSLASSTKTFRWLVVKCQLADVPTIPAGLDAQINQFFGISGAGYGNMVDYFHDVSYNQASVISDKTLGWIKVPFKSTDLTGSGRLAGNRKQRVIECLQATPADQLTDLDEYYGVVVINNTIQDGGAAYIGQQSITIGNKSFNLACVWFDPKSLKTEFAAHEIAHGLGLDHSFADTKANCGGLPGEYCDPFDIMSAQGTYQFVDPNFLFQGNPTGGGPGLNAPGLLRMGWIPADNQPRFQHEGGEQGFTLRALSHPRGTGPLVVILDVGSEQPLGGIYTIEYRQADGWDEGFAGPSAPATVQLSKGVVLVHQFLPAGAPASTWITRSAGGALQPCNTLVLQGVAGAVFHVSVLGFDIADGFAKITVGFGRGSFLPCDILKKGVIDTRHVH